MASGCFCLYLWRLPFRLPKCTDFSFLSLFFARNLLTSILPGFVQVRTVASLTLSFSAAMTPVSAVSSAIRTRCTSMWDCLDLTGSQRRHYAQQLQDTKELNDHQQEQLRNLLRDKDSLIGQQQEQLRNMEASLLQQSEEANGTQNQLRSAHDQLQKRKQAFSQFAHPVSSLKLQSASGQPAQAMKAVQAPSPSKPTNSRLAVVRQPTNLLQLQWHSCSHH